MSLLASFRAYGDTLSGSADGETADREEQEDDESNGGTGSTGGDTRDSGQGDDHSGDFYEDEVEDINAARGRKRLKVFAKKVAGDLGIPVDLLEAFTDLSVDERMMTIYGQLLMYSRDKEADAGQAYLESALFTNILELRLTAVLVSPYLSAYHTNLAEKVFEYARVNPDAFKIPHSVQNDPDLMQMLLSKIRDMLTVLRGKLKYWLVQSVEHGYSAEYALAGFLKKCVIDARGAHWGCFAFLRRSLVVFLQQEKKSILLPSEENNDQEEPQDQEPAAKEEPQYSASSYWGFVDDLLSEQRADAHSKASADMPYHTILQKEVSETLRKDLKKYPLYNTDGTQKTSKKHGGKLALKKRKRGPPSDVQPQEWQDALEKALVWL
ncbi:hypothetical protein NM688_g4828 [Phlebia brevispora]|uniref:Uncharacterized protein n=1 Tax=Phlebia brevispora TaxID=194682 RepID=A0ACC1T224_9APHY|nr:hypothetical protein NM688_g4828 [Phlebia brevispora]